MRINEHTIVSLGYAILDTTTLSQIRDLGPVLVRVGIGAESTTVAMVGRTRARTGIIARAIHGKVYYSVWRGVVYERGMEEEESRSII